MKMFHGFILGTAILMPAPLVADSLYTDEEVQYRGERSATRVCEAIVEDDARQLNVLLKEVKRRTLMGYRFDTRSYAIAGSVTCNGLGLMVFADEIGADSVSSYLRGGVVTMEELVTTTQ